MTVNRALRELMGEGLVTRVQGSGTFVAELHRISSTLAIRDIHDEVIERGHVHTSRLLLAESEKASADLVHSLGLRSGARDFHTILIHLENGVPIQYEDRYVNPAAAPDYLKTDFSQTTPTRHLLEEAPLTEASYSIEACLVMIRRTVVAGFALQFCQKVSTMSPPGRLKGSHRHAVARRAPIRPPSDRKFNRIAQSTKPWLAKRL